MSTYEEVEEPSLLDRVLYANEVCSSLVSTLQLLPSVNCATDLVANSKILLRLAEQLLEENQQIQKLTLEKEAQISQAILNQLDDSCRYRYQEDSNE